MIRVNGQLWTRESGDTAADTIWNASRSGCKQITLESTDADNDAQIICTYTETAGSYGSVRVYADNNALVADYDTSISDAGDVFTIEDGMLKVTTSSAHGTDYSLENGTLTVNEGFSGTLTSTVTFNSTPQTKEIDFEYDHNGMHTKKTVTENGRTEITEYTLHGKLITHMTKRSAGADGSESVQDMHFYYDVQSHPTFVEHNGVKYRYVYNLQGDVIGIIDHQGSAIVEYMYDTWGNLISANDFPVSILRDNFARYRAYTWDQEINLYYLNNRYYCSKHQRFISSDEYVGEGLNNVFAYTCNAVVKYADMDGKKTYACGITTNAYVGFISSSVTNGICWDDWGNEGTFVTYGGIEGEEAKKDIPGWTDDYSTCTMGLFSIGDVSFYSETNLDCITDLNGISCSIGIGAFDLIYSGKISDMDNKYLGYQVSKGFSYGIDFGHLSNQYTVVTITKSNNIQSKNSTKYKGIEHYYLKHVYDPLLGYYRDIRIFY